MVDVVVFVVGVVVVEVVAHVVCGRHEPHTQGVLVHQVKRGWKQRRKWRYGVLRCTAWLIGRTCGRALRYCYTVCFDF